MIFSYDDTIFTQKVPLWDRRYHARLSRSGLEFDPRSGQVYRRGFFGVFLICKDKCQEALGHKVPEYHLTIIIINHHSLRPPMT